MKTITIVLTDAEFCEIMSKANAVHSKCERMTDKPLTRAKTILSTWAKLNLQRNAEFFAREMGR